MEARVKWANGYSCWITRWGRSVFPDEKKFNLDGPYGFSFYWDDLRKEQQYFSKRQQGCGGVTLWAEICYNVASNLIIVNGTLDSNKYCEVRTKCLLPFASEEYPAN